jgi:3-oxoacyl-[acyl-carrier-protein] synthase-3
MASELGSYGEKAESLWIPGGGTKYPTSQEVVDARNHYIQMDGQEVFKFATKVVAQSLARVIEEAGLTPDDIDLYIPHQANLRIIEAGARMLGQPIEKFYVNIHKYGNTSAASVPIAFVEAIQEGRLKEGDTVAVVAFGGGLSWGAAVMQLGVSEIARAYDAAAMTAK